MASQTIIDVEVTIKKTLIPYSSRGEKLAPFTVRIGEKLQYNDNYDELIVKLPHGIVRKVKLTKSELERFTKYI